MPWEHCSKAVDSVAQASAAKAACPLASHRSAREGTPKSRTRCSTAEGASAAPTDRGSGEDTGTGQATPSTPEGPG